MFGNYLFRESVAHVEMHVQSHIHSQSPALTLTAVYLSSRYLVSIPTELKSIQVSVDGYHHQSGQNQVQHIVQKHISFVQTYLETRYLYSAWLICSR